MSQPVDGYPFGKTQQKPRYQSPEDTFEVVLKSVMEDPSFTDAEFRVLLYAATKPKDWVLSVKQIAAALDRSEESVRRALIGLRKKGYVSIVVVRDDNNRYRRRTSHLQRCKVIRKTET